ncbi:MAG TPA: aconitate hydratase, partial [Bdellovibrionota bacterium]|nr:aconitate hydratase [Bdellovibrionota bacterium]
MAKNVAQKLIENHLMSGKMIPGEEIQLKIDQTLTQDATGTMVMLELVAMGLEKAKTELSAQYVDHNILQTDFKNADDHLFLQSACKKFGIWFSPPGNGVSHPIHMERFGIPGKTLLGSDSHTCAAGSLGMLAIGAGGLEVALAIAGMPFYTRMPQIVGVRLIGKFPKWVSAKDVILEMLRRYDVDGGIGKIFEYFGPGLSDLSAMDRHTIANMGQETGATASVFPSDKETKRFLKSQGRMKVWKEIVADKDAEYDLEEEINLSKLEPLIALPSSPGNVVPVREVEGREIYQAMIGSSANPGFRDFAVPALMVKGKHIHERVSFDVNPTSRQILENLTAKGYLTSLIQSGARIHQAGCNGCIGMGQAPATGRNSLRTVPRNFPGRSGTKEDSVFLCSPETATASALKGVITDPRKLKMKFPKMREPDKIIIDRKNLIPPAKDGEKVELIMGPNIKPLAKFDPLPDSIEGPVLLKMGNNISTDEILPAGTNVLPFRSNIPEIAKFTFSQIDEAYYQRAIKYQKTGSLVVGGSNYGQGSSREHAAIAPRYLGL